MPRPKYVEHSLARGDEVVGDDTPVAPPPNGFRTHDYASCAMAELAQPRCAGLEVAPHGVVGEIVKALVLPETVYLRRYVPLAAMCS